MEFFCITSERMEDKITAALAQARREGMEQAAKIAFSILLNGPGSATAEKVAAAIRAAAEGK